eukprot:m.1367644 g.1367644  ORF g.1367644 m.1367644 type:complete len:462 (+) comp24953_c0_seq15:96-1481(+)
MIVLVLILVSIVKIGHANHNGVGQLPVMGWSGYNAFMQHSGHCDAAGSSGYNETTFVQTMDALKQFGLADLGYVYLNADDCWIAENRTADGKLTSDTSRFPHGMAWLIEQAHSRSLKFGLYAAASKETCRQYPGSQGHEETDAATFMAWNADFVKLDSCGGTLNAGPEAWADQYGRWSRALNASGRQAVFSCSWAVYFSICAAKFPPSAWDEQCGQIPWQNHFIGDICHLWRYGEDLEPVWRSGATPASPMNGCGGSGIADIIDFAGSFWADAFRGATGPGAFNDPDFLVVGCPTDRPCEPHSARGTTGVAVGAAPLTDREQRTQFSMWCLLGAPLIIGSDIRHLTPTAVATLSNRDAIAVNQDPGAYPAQLVKALANGARVWVRPMVNGDVAVAIVNLNDTHAVDVTIALTEIRVDARSDKATSMDLWTKEASPLSSGVLEVQSLAAHDTRLLRIQGLSL